MTAILASCGPGEIRVAVLDEAGEFVRYALWRPGAPDGLDDVHAGRIATRVPAMAGAFVDIGGATGFLPDTDGAAGLTEGSLLTVRITRTSQGGKGPRLVAVPDASPAGAPGLLRYGQGAMRRLAAEYPDAPLTLDDPAMLPAMRSQLGARVQLAACSFPAWLEDAIDALAAPAAELPGGMRASLVPTPALTAIDVDGGSTTASRGAKGATQMAANRACLPALVREIVLRDLSGAILIDFAGIPARRRAALAPDLEAALARDPMRPRLLGFSHLGFAEILRPRGAAPLHEQLAGPHAAGLAALRRVAAEQPRRPLLRATPAVVASLQADTAALAGLAHRLVHPLILRSDPTLPPCGWTIEDAA